MSKKQSEQDTAGSKREKQSRMKDSPFWKAKEREVQSAIETNTQVDGYYREVKNNKKIDCRGFENSEESRPVSQESFSIEQIASDTLLKRLDDPGIANELEKEREVYSEDEDGSSLSSPSVASSLSDMENPCSTASASDQSVGTKKENDDIASAHTLEPLEPGKKKADFQSQLKKTGLSPRLNLSGKISKKDQSEKIDLRKNLKSVSGSGFTRWGSWSEKYGPSLRERPSQRVDQDPPKRRISSSDLFDLIKHNEPPKPVEEKQRKVSLPYTFEPPKIVEPKDEHFDSLMAQRKKSSSRQFPVDIKKSSSKYAPAWSPNQLRKATYVPSLPGSARKLSAGSMGSVGSERNGTSDAVDLPDADIDRMLKDVDVTNLESVQVEEPKPVPRPKRKASSGNIKCTLGNPAWCTAIPLALSLHLFCIAP